MATPAGRFTAKAASSDGQQDLPLRLPPSLAALPPTPAPASPAQTAPEASGDLAVEVDRVVPASGNMFAAGRQIWLGKPLAGQQVTLRLNHSTLHVFHDGQLIKTHPVTLADKDLTRLRSAGAKPARPSRPPPCHPDRCPPTPSSKSSA
jgi:hypothetical protein